MTGLDGIAARPAPQSARRKWLLGGTAFAAIAIGIAPRSQAAGLLTQGANAAVAPVSAGIASALASEQRANTVAVQAQNQLARITTALQSMQNMQTAARNLAISQPSTIPDGLQSGGLEPDSGLQSAGVAKPVTSWVNAQTPVQTAEAGKTTVTINQTAAQALLSWKTFNVSKNTTVQFNQQGNSNWVALNQIAATGVPSKIMGSVKASGQVYLINQNGIIFGGASQINVNSLVASAANITDSQFVTNGIYSPETNLTYTPSFTNANGDIVVARGAQITTNAPASVTTGGGFVLMLGKHVQNGGSISTPGGQTELAAGDNFLIRSGYSTNSNATSTTRGNEIEPLLITPGSSLTGGSGLVANTGVITADTGDITLAGETVQQNGVAMSSISVAVRGTIHLITPGKDTHSSVTLGPNATTLIEPDLSSTATELDSQRAALIASSATANAARAGAVQTTPQFDDVSLLPDQQENSRIEIVTGGTAHFADGSESAAPGGQIAVSAALRVQADSGAALDVSGSYLNMAGSAAVPMAMASNAIAVNIQSFELRDDPQNRLAQVLRNNTVYVDQRTVSAVAASSADSSTRDYTAGGLLEVSGYLANVGHTIGEYTAVGGTIDLSTGTKGSIVAQSGSIFNLDGGALQYQSGYLQQSYVIASNGHIYNVNNAPADLTYTGVYNGFAVNHPAWGVTQTFQNDLNAPAEIYQTGYIFGRAAGSIQLSSPTTVFDGAIHASAINGTQQTAADPANVTDPYLLTQSEVAQNGSLIIASLASNALTVIDTNVEIAAAKAPTVSATKKLAHDLTGSTVVAASVINKAELGGLQILTDGSIDVAAAVTLAPGAAVSLQGSSVDIGANITAAGGSVTASEIVTLGTTPVVLAVPKVKNAASATGDIVLEAGNTISTAGLWTNLESNPNITFTQAYSNGGTVNLTSAASLILRGGSKIDSSAGGIESITGAVSGGNGGNITLAAASTPSGTTGLAGTLVLHAKLDGIGASAGGALTLSAPAFLITRTESAALGATVLNPALFSSGFSAYNLLSTDDIAVAPGTIVNVVEPSYQVEARADLPRTGARAASVFDVALNPLYVANSSDTAITQRAGASFNATIYSNAAISTSNGSVLSVGDGAAINVDPGQAINLQATGQITIDGSLKAPGGTISAVSAFNTQAALPDGPGTVSVWVGPGARLNANAKAVSFTGASGNKISLAPSGGSITLGSSLSTASVIIREGATLTASGSAAVDRVGNSTLNTGEGSAVTPGQDIAVEGAGGTISLASAEGIYNDGVLKAAAGGPDAAGGTLAMTLEADVVANAAGTAEATPRIFTITQANPGPQQALDLVPGASDFLQIGTAAISAAQINKGGFGSVTLYARDAFLFDGNVTLNAAQSIKLEEGVETDTSRSGSVTLNAPYVLLSGQSFDTTNGAVPIPFAVITGYSARQAHGVFTVNAANIGISDGVRFGGVLPADGATPASDLAGFGTVDLNSSGDLQFLPNTAYTGSGTGVANVSDIITTADLNLTAREIYATGTPLTGTGNGVANLATTALVIAGYDPTAAGAHGSFNTKGVLNISRAAGSVPSAPDVLLGAITFEAATINQGGVIWQPLGRLTLGNIATSDTTIDRTTVISGDPKSAVNFLPGSVTSVSAAGMSIPFGGTTDGVNYDVLGQALVANANSASTVQYGLDTVTNGVGTGTITVAAQNTSIEPGATLDLQGGGQLTGAGFISGEGGSTDVLTTPLVSYGGSGATQPSLASHPVYAIVAGVQPVSAVAYTQSGATGSPPALGQQIVIPAGVPGLPAGTYTLLPAAYALEPGGYRVEFDGAAALNAATVTPLANGSYAVAGYTALANTNVHGTLPASLTITAAATVQNYSDYFREDYSSFLRANAATNGAIRPVLPADGGTLALTLPVSVNDTLTNAGAVSFAAASGGIGGTLQITGPRATGTPPDIDIYGTAPTAGLAGTISLSAEEIDAFNPFVLEIGAAGGGGTQAYVKGITLENGATLKAARVVLTATSDGITLNGGSKVTTINEGSLPADSMTQGLLSNQGASVLDVGNGYLAYSTTPSQDTSYGPITIADGAQIYTDGSIAFSTSAAVTIGVAASLGGRYLDLALPEINIGDAETLAANAPPGLDLTPAVLQTLTRGVPESDVPALQILNLSAFGSLNFFGNTSLDLSGSNVELEINAPAIYGYGGSDAVATVSASTILWNGISTVDPTDTNGLTLISSLPGATTLGGAGSGKGTLDFDASTIILGYSALDVPQKDVSLNRLTAGFSFVNLNAGSEITANNAGSLAVYQKITTYGQPGTGGTLNLNTPLLTAANGAKISFVAGGDVNLAPPAGVVAAAGLATEAAGGEIDLAGENIGIDGSIILPSGKLDLAAQNNILLGSGARLGLAGTTTQNVDQTIYGFGGTLTMASANGSITQNAGSVIDVSAVNNSAGSVAVTATGAAGNVALNGSLLGSSTGTLAGTSGVFDVSAKNIGDFAALNASLTAGGFFQSRSFDIQQGDLVIGNGVQAHAVSVSVDHGSLTVAGLIDARGNGGGSISLAASNNLTLAATGALDAQGNVLQVDSYGQAIASENAPVVSLTATKGELTLDAGARIDLASADGVARGDLELNVPRLASATSGDANIKAAAPLNIAGAATIAVNAYWTYTGLADPNKAVDGNADGLITQAYLDQINSSDTQPFMTAAAGNADLAGRVAGLSAYAAYHLRPGISIESATPNGDLTVQGDIDLAGYRYGSGVNAADYGSGEPGVLQIRAGGNLNVYGSITDGFEKPVSDAGTEFANGWVIYGTEPNGENQVIPTSVGIAMGSALSDSAPVNFAVKIDGGSFVAGAVAPVALTLAKSQTVTTGFIATSDIDAGGTTLFARGSFVPAGSVLPKNAVISAGGSLPFAVMVGKVVWPANTPFTVLTNIASGGLGVIVASDMTLQAGSFIPADSLLVFQKGDPGLKHPTAGAGAYVDTRPVGADGSQGQLYGLASQMPAGNLSWSIGLVSGADLNAANPDAVRSASALAAAGVAGDVTLADTHYGIKGTANIPAFSVIRTGTGSLSMAAGGSINEQSSFGIYTAGTQSAAILVNGLNPYDLSQGLEGTGGTLLGKNNAALAALDADYAANYPSQGGNVLITAQKSLNGFIFSSNSGINNSDAIGNWLWRQGGAGIPAAWWVEYGTLNLGAGVATGIVQYTGFQGIGTLGGGNLTVNAGGDASGLDLVVASNGRVQTDGSLVQNGGGAMNVTIGGAVNFVEAGSAKTYNSDAGGVISDLRGNSVINAGSIGTVLPVYGQVAAGDLRFLSPYDSETANFGNGLELAPGDGTVTVNARGDLIIDSADNPGTVGNMANAQNVQITQNGVATPGFAITDFSLWTSSTGVDLFSAGGNAAPVETIPVGLTDPNDTAAIYYPPNLNVIAQNGNIYAGSAPVELAPSPDGQLQWLAAGSIIGDGSLVAMSGAALSNVATPFDPGITLFTGQGAKLQTVATNISTQSSGSPVDFGPDTPTTALHAEDTQPARIYAATGDILGIEIGQLSAATTTNVQRVAAAKPFDVYAGRDIVQSGSIASPDIFLNLSPNDISSVTAGRDIIESSFDIAGPGQLVVQAGRDYKALAHGVIDSIGPIFDIDPNNRNSGAGVVLLAGTGAAGPDYAGFANAFINPASTLVIINRNGENVGGMVVAQDDASLTKWLQANAGYTGTEANAYAYFQTLSPGLQQVFLRRAYFDLLDTSGKDYNDPANSLGLAKTYILGRDAIAALFPAQNAAGAPITYAGDITMYGDSGVHTDFGGDIETLTPGGQTIVGVEGTTPPASAGIITQGSGDIDMYALTNVELGESRVLTTFGGNIVIWSAQGDINAGRGSKTTIDFAPLQRLYDKYGDVFLSPTTPSSGAGIATLNPIPSVPAGNIDLIAPLGTIDAGEAGIRSSGKTNLAAQTVLNGANISSQQGTTGAPTASAPDVGAITSTSAAAGAAAQAAQNTTAKTQATPQPSIWIVEILGYGGGAQPDDKKKHQQQI